MVYNACVRAGSRLAVQAHFHGTVRTDLNAVRAAAMQFSETGRCDLPEFSGLVPPVGTAFRVAERFVAYKSTSAEGAVTCLVRVCADLALFLWGSRGLRASRALLIAMQHLVSCRARLLQSCRTNSRLLFWDQAV